MARLARSKAALAVVCLVLLVAAPGASAFSFGELLSSLFGKKAEAPVAEAPATEAPAAEPAAAPALYWYNDVTGESQWEEPKYEFVNEEGQTYYTDPVTKETSWEKPVSLQWSTLVDAEGRTYYFNEATKFSQWDAPAALAWKQLAAQQQEPKSEL